MHMHIILHLNSLPHVASSNLPIFMFCPLFVLFTYDIQDMSINIFLFLTKFQPKVFFERFINTVKSI